MTNTPTRLMRVLIVDDLAQVRQDLRLLLQLSGEMDIAGEAASGREAVALTQALQPDVVLMDIEMPGMDGCEAAQQIKARWPSVRVVALSIHNYPAAWLRASQAGMDGFIAKGASLQTILETLKERKE